MSSATPISPDILGGAAISENSAVPSTDPAAAIQEAPTPELAQSLNHASGTPTTAKELVAESLASDAAAPQSASVLATGQDGATAQVDPALQNATQLEAAPAGPVAATGQPAVVETPKKLGKGPIEVTEKEALPERELNPELLTSRSLSQPGAENAAGDTPHNDASASNRQDARPEGAEIARGLKSGFATGRETPQVQPAVHEVQESKSNVTHHVPDFASSMEKQGATATTSSEAGFTPVAATETASPILSAPATLGSAGIGEPAAKLAGTSHSNGNWSQVEKAQVVSQIVERAHLLGKNHSEVMVVLKPEFLGKVNLHAAMVDNQLVATIMAESASVKQMLEGQLSSLQTALHEQGLPVAKVEVVQGSQLSFADLGAGQSSSQQHLESGRSQLPPALLSLRNPRRECRSLFRSEAHIYAPPTSRSLNLVA